MSFEIIRMQLKINGKGRPMVVRIKIALTAVNLWLDKNDSPLDISCGGDLKVMVTVERGEREGNCICSARLGCHAAN